VAQMIRALLLRGDAGEPPGTRLYAPRALAWLAAAQLPPVDRSADRADHGRITRAGSPWLRWALVEMARHAIKRPDAVGRWARRLAVRKGLNRARVALARVLCDQVVTTWPKTTVES
jgi:transposase